VKSEGSVTPDKKARDASDDLIEGSDNLSDSSSSSEEEVK